MIKVVVPVSGGKDSQACLQLATQHYEPREILGLFCDTQFEHGLTYAHVARMREMYGVHVQTITNGSVEEQCFKYGRFPGGGARFCTDELKIRPAKRFYKTLAELQGAGFEVWLGVRSDESGEREKRYAGKVCDEVYAPHEVMSKYPKYLAKLGVMFRLAVLDWSEADVKSFVGMDNLNPLYRPPYNMGRVGCFPCLASGDKTKEKAFSADEFGAEQRAKVIRIGTQIGKNIFTSKGGRVARCAHIEGH